jgi:hypothetical protein
VDPDHLEPDDWLRPYLPGLRQLLRADTGQAPEGHGLAKYQNDGDPRTSGPGFAVTCHEDVLTKPLSWRRPRTVFVNSMSDVGHARVPVEFVARISPDRTVAAVSSRSGTAPMMPMSGSRTSRWVLTVLGARPARPSASQSLIACATV